MLSSSARTISVGGALLHAGRRRRSVGRSRDRAGRSPIPATASLSGGAGQCVSPGGVSPIRPGRRTPSRPSRRARRRRSRRRDPRSYAPESTSSATAMSPARSAPVSASPAQTSRQPSSRSRPRGVWLSTISRRAPPLHEFVGPVVHVVMDFVAAGEEDGGRMRSGALGGDQPPLRGKTPGRFSGFSSNSVHATAGRGATIRVARSSNPMPAGNARAWRERAVRSAQLWRRARFRDA